MEKQFKGRSIDLQFLAALILSDTAKNSGMPIEKYLEIIKKYVLEISKTGSDDAEGRNVTFDKMFKELKKRWK